MTGYVPLCSVFILIFTVGFLFADPEVTFQLDCHQTHLNATFTTSRNDTNLFKRNMTATLNDDNCLYYEDSNGHSTDDFTLFFSMEFSEGCGTTYADNEEHIFSNQTILLRVTDFLRNGDSQRDFYYSYEASCQMNRNFSVETANNYKVDKAVVVTKNESQVGTYTYDMEMKFYDSTFGTAYADSSSVVVGVNEMLYVQIAEVSNSSEFNFVVENCEAIDSLPYSGATIKDEFFKNKCPLDPTFNTISHTGRVYQFEFQAFYFPQSTTDAIYLKCQVFVCHKDDQSGTDCQQTCTGLKRKRRDASSASVEIATDERKRLTLVSPKIVLKTDKTCADVVCGVNSKCKELQPAACICDEGYVFSRIQMKCIKERITQIDKIHLDNEWNPDYLDTNSDAFYRLALKYEEVLYKSIKAAGTEHVIEGVRVTKATKGSVILEVRIIYAVASSPVESYNYFVESLKAKSRIATNVRKDLKLLTDTTPEIVQIQEKMADIQRLTLIIIIVVLLLLVLLAGVTVIVVRKRRSRAVKATATVPGFDNNGVVMEKFH